MYKQEGSLSIESHAIGSQWIRIVIFIKFFFLSLSQSIDFFAPAPSCQWERRSGCNYAENADLVKILHRFFSQGYWVHTQEEENPIWSTIEDEVENKLRIGGMSWIFDKSVLSDLLASNGIEIKPLLSDQNAVKKDCTRRGARTPDHTIKSRALYRLS